MYDTWFLRYQQKIKISKQKMETACGDIIILHKYTRNHDHRRYCSWDMVRDTSNCYFSFWAIFCPFAHPPTPLPIPLLLPAQNIKIAKKMKKNFWRYHHFTHVYHKLWLDDVQFLRYGAWQTDGQTDGRMKKVTYGGRCLKIDNINRHKWMLVASD